MKILGFLKEVYVGNIFGMSEDLDVFFILILIPGFFSNVFLGAFKAVVIPNYIFAQKKGNLIFQNNVYKNDDDKLEKTDKVTPSGQF